MATSPSRNGPFCPCPATAWQRRQAKDVLHREFPGLHPTEVSLIARESASRRSASTPLVHQNQRDLRATTPPSRRQLPVERGLVVQIRGVAAPPNHSALKCANFRIETFDSLSLEEPLDGPRRFAADEDQGNWRWMGLRGWSPWL